MAKRMILMIALLFLVFGGIFGWRAIRAYYMHEYFARHEPPPLGVSAEPLSPFLWCAPCIPFS